MTLAEMTPEQRERRRYALLQAAAVLATSGELDLLNKSAVRYAVDVAELLLKEIERREP